MVPIIICVRRAPHLTTLWSNIIIDDWVMCNLSQFVSLGLIWFLIDQCWIHGLMCLWLFQLHFVYILCFIVL